MSILGFCEMLVEVAQLKYKELLKNILIFAIGGLGTKLILFLLVPLYTNYLTPEEYGISELVFTVSQFLIPIVTLTIFDAVIRFGLSLSEKKNNVLLVALIVWTIGSIALVFFSPIVNCFPSISQWKWYLIAYVVFSGLSQIELNYLKVIDKNVLYSSASILQSLVLAISNVVLIVFFKAGIRGYLFSSVISLCITCIVCFIIADLWRTIKKAKIDFSLLQRMIVYSAPLILNNISWWLIHSTDKVMINWMIGATALGIYTVAGKIPSLVNVVSGFFVQAWGLSSIKEIETSNDTVFYSKIFKIISGITLLLCIGINSFIRPFMLFYTGEAFNTAWQYVPALLLAATFNAISSYFAAFYAALKKSMHNMLTSTLSAVLNIIVNYIFILRVGAWGAVIGTFCSYLLIAYLRLFDVKRYVDIEIDWKVHLCSVIIAFVHMLFITLQFHTILASICAVAIVVYLHNSELLEFVDIIKKSMKKGNF